MIYTANDKSLPFDYRRVMGFDVFFFYWDIDGIWDKD
jgi:hypothetical protein